MLFDMFRSPEKTPPELGEDARRLRLRFTGQVQGVGFRWTSQRCARELGLTGWVRNEDDGSVSMELQGADATISRFFTAIVQSYQRYPIHYHMEEKEDIALKPDESDFSVLY